MKMDVKLKVFTLNCWGIVGISKHRRERFLAIADHLANSDYDFVFLQEVWSQEDYEMLCRKTAVAFPYSFYFHSGVIGGGVCIFTKGRIVDTAQHQYVLNGYAHKIQHGDWFGGKVVGLCKVIHHGLCINLYVTHMHAEYDSLNDTYLSHRVAQAFEYSQFARVTSGTGDLSILAGDFNTEPGDLLYRIIVNNVGCSDAFLTKAAIGDSTGVGATCGHPGNTYTPKKELEDCPTGKRIDYIMYKCGRGTTVQCLSCEAMLGKTAENLSFSDHEAVVADLHIYKTSEATDASAVNPEAQLQTLREAHELMETSLASLKNDRIFYIFMSCLIMCLLLVSIPVNMPIGFGWVLIVVRVILSLAFGFSAWMGGVMNTIEHNALLAAKKGMRVLIDNVTNRNDSSVGDGHTSPTVTV